MKKLFVFSLLSLILTAQAQAFFCSQTSGRQTLTVQITSLRAQLYLAQQRALMLLADLQCIPSERPNRPVPDKPRRLLDCANSENKYEVTLIGGGLKGTKTVQVYSMHPEKKQIASIRCEK